MSSSTISNRWILITPENEQPMQLIRPSRWDRLQARLRSHRLDRELAEGLSADSDRLRAVRASMLITPQARAALAGYWQTLLTTAARPWRVTDPGLPLPRKRILTARPLIDELICELRSPRPVSARGVALASQLLVDGLGPVRNLRSEVNLKSVIQAAIDHLDPRTELCAC